jgi:UDP-GlcNAc:undecaprenyl-phosphate GlcNAc-1-phosphate transferase
LSAATPILLLALPILDTLSVMVQRVSEKRSPFSADRNHIHHKLLALGFDHHEAVMVIYAIQADLFLLAYWFRYESDVTILGVVSLFFVAAIAFFQTAAHRGWRVRGSQDAELDSPLSRFLATLREPKNLPRWSYWAVALAVGVYTATILAKTAKLSGDVQFLLAALLAVVTILLLILRAKPLKIIEKAALYTTAAVLVYLDNLVPAEERLLAVLSWTAIGVAAAATVLRLRLSSDRRFVLTPLDLIVLFVALVVPSLPGSFALPHGGAAGIAKVVTLFYALEVLVSRAELGVVWLRIAVAAVLTGLVLRPLVSI